MSESMSRAVLVALSLGVAVSRAGAQAVAPAVPADSAGVLRLTLAQSVELAQARGQSAKAAVSARDEARWENRAFGARLKPQLLFQGLLPSYTHSITPVVQPNGATQFFTLTQVQSTVGLQLSQEVPALGGRVFLSSGVTRIDLPGVTNRATRYFQTTPLAIGIEQNLFRPRTLRWDAREQDLRSTVADRQYLEAREDVAANAAGAFFDLYAADAALENAATNAAVNDTLFVLSKGRYEVGKIGENDLLQSELATLRARTALDGARLERDRAEAQLKRLIDYRGPARLTVAQPADAPAFEADTARAVAAALRNASQIENYDLQRVQARRRLAAARLNNGPGATVTASAGLNQTADAFGNSYRSPLGSQAFQLSVAMPIVQWGAGHAEVEAARAEGDRVESASRASREQIMENAHFTALQLAQSRRQLLIAAKADTVAAKRFEVAKNRYVIGKIDIGALYIAQSEKDQARLSYVQSLSGFWGSYYRLRRVTLYDFAADREIR
jgi:outer membrane protein